MKDDALRTQIEITLTVPVPVKGADGKEAERTKLMMRRPKTRHAKRLAALVGQDLLNTLVTDGSDDVGEQSNADTRLLVARAIGQLFDTGHLDGLTEIIADMCGETPDLIDEIDLIDLPQLGKAFLGFFPALRSAALTLLPQT